ncbi:unnamed protein product [Merluccius merluccius]
METPLVPSLTQVMNFPCGRKTEQKQYSRRAASGDAKPSITSLHASTSCGTCRASPLQTRHRHPVSTASLGGLGGMALW